MVLNIQNIKSKLMGVHDLGIRSHQYSSTIEFLWVDEWVEGIDSQYRIGFNYDGVEYSTYLHRYPHTPNHYYMGCYGPNMKEYRLQFNYKDFSSPIHFILSLIRQIDSYVNN
jgi:hypothetical protein